MVSAIDVARFFVKLACDEPELEPMTHLRLQKLLYYAQGWSLAYNERPLFGDILEAWQHGPVVPNVFREFADYKKEPIPSCCGNEDGLGDDDKAFIKSIWEGYKEFSPFKLTQMTHSEQPWLIARGSTPPDQRSKEEISQRSLRKWFAQQAKKHTILGLESEKLEEAERAFKEKRGISLSSLKAKDATGLKRVLRGTKPTRRKHDQEIA